MINREELLKMSTNELLIMVLERLDRLETRMDRLEERMDRLEERMDRIEERMDRIEERMDKLEVRVGEVEKRTESIAEDLELLHFENGGEHTKLYETSMDIKARVTQLEKTSEENSARLKKVERDLKTLDSQFQTVSGKFDKLLHTELISMVSERRAEYLS